MVSLASELTQNGSLKVHATNSQRKQGTPFRTGNLKRSENVWKVGLIDNFRKARIAGNEFFRVQMSLNSYRGAPGCPVLGRELTA